MHNQQRGVASPLSDVERQTVLERWGDFSLAYSVAHQPRLNHFGGGEGFLAYAQRAGYTFVLGDPLCDPVATPDLLADFLKQFPRAMFVQISRRTAEVLAKHKFYVNEIGVDTCIDLPQYSFSGKDREWLRYADNWLTRRGYRIVEGLVRDHEAAIEYVSEAWRGSRTIKRKEVRFLNRPMPMVDEADVRRWLLFNPDGQLEAFVFFDPIYRDRQRVGYVTCIKRRLPECSSYAESAIMKRAMETFQQEGVSQLWLGLSPGADIADQDFRANRWLSWGGRYVHRAGWFNRYLYNFNGHTQYKRRFRGRETKAYLATPSGGLNSLRLLTLVSLCGAF